jgi:hypothetical protein
MHLLLLHCLPAQPVNQEVCAVRGGEREPNRPSVDALDALLQLVHEVDRAVWLLTRGV